MDPHLVWACGARLLERSAPTRRIAGEGARKRQIGVRPGHKNRHTEFLEQHERLLEGTRRRHDPADVDQRGRPRGLEDRRPTTIAGLEQRAPLAIAVSDGIAQSPCQPEHVRPERALRVGHEGQRVAPWTGRRLPAIEHVQRPFDPAGHAQLRHQRPGHQSPETLVLPFDPRPLVATVNDPRVAAQPAPRGLEHPQLIAGTAGAYAVCRATGDRGRVGSPDPAEHQHLTPGPGERCALGVVCRFALEAGEDLLRQRDLTLSSERDRERALGLRPTPSGGGGTRTPLSQSRIEGRLGAPGRRDEQPRIATLSGVEPPAGDPQQLRPERQPASLRRVGELPAERSTAPDGHPAPQRVTVQGVGKPQDAPCLALGLLDQRPTHQSHPRRRVDQLDQQRCVGSVGQRDGFERGALVSLKLGQSGLEHIPQTAGARKRSAPPPPVWSPGKDAGCLCGLQQLATEQRVAACRLPDPRVDPCVDRSVQQRRYQLVDLGSRKRLQLEALEHPVLPERRHGIRGRLAGPDGDDERRQPRERERMHQRGRHRIEQMRVIHHQDRVLACGAQYRAASQHHHCQPIPPGQVTVWEKMRERAERYAHGRTRPDHPNDSPRTPKPVRRRARQPRLPDPGRPHHDCTNAIRERSLDRASLLISTHQLIHVDRVPSNTGGRCYSRVPRRPSLGLSAKASLAEEQRPGYDLESMPERAVR